MCFIAPAASMQRALVALAALGTSASASADVPVSSALTLSVTIPLPGIVNRIGQDKFDHLEGHAATGLLFAACKMNNSVAVIDMVAGTFLTALENLQAPQGVEVVDSLGLVLVATSGDGMLHGFSLAPPFASLFEPVFVGLDADNVLFDATTSLAWIGHGGNDGVPAGLAYVLVTASSAEFMGDAPFPAHPEESSLSLTSNLTYVSCPMDNSNIHIFNRWTHQIVGSWPLLLQGASQPFANVLDAALNRLYIATQANDGLATPQFLVLNAQDGSVVWRVPTTGVCDNVKYDSDAGLIYIACGGTGDSGSLLYVVQQTVAAGGAAAGSVADSYALLGTAQGEPAGLVLARTLYWEASAARLYLSVPQNYDISPHQEAAILVFARTTPALPVPSGNAQCDEPTLSVPTISGISVGVAFVALAVGVLLGRSAWCGTGGTSKAQADDEEAAYALQ